MVTKGGINPIDNPCQKSCQDSLVISRDKPGRLQIASARGLAVLRNPRARHITAARAKIIFKKRPLENNPARAPLHFAEIVG